MSQGPVPGRRPERPGPIERPSQIVSRQPVHQVTITNAATLQIVDPVRGTHDILGFAHRPVRFVLQAHKPPGSPGTVSDTVAPRTTAPTHNRPAPTPANHWPSTRVGAAHDRDRPYDP